MDIATAKEQIKDTVEAYLAKDDAGVHKLAVSRQRPIFLLGAPGIGKTAIMEQIAGELNIGIVSYSMTHHTRQSALGLPKIVHEEFEGFEYDASEYTMSEIVSSIYDYMKATGLREGILFLDEVNCVSETLYPSMLQFLQFKTFGRHRIPDDWVIVCAGNPPEYNKSVHNFDIVTLDRLREMRIEPDYEAWKRYAAEKGLHPAVTTFLEAKHDCFYKVQSKPGGEKSFVTARGWEDLADIIELYEEMGKSIDRDLIGQFLHDEDIADRFATYYVLFDKYRSDYQVMQILDGTADPEIAERARVAEFDERVALVGLLLDALGSACEKAVETEKIALDLRDELREAKQPIVGGGNAREVLEKAISRRSSELNRKMTSRTANVKTIRHDRKVLDALKNFVAECEKQGKTSGPEAFAIINDCYRNVVDMVDPAIDSADSKMTNAFEFMDKAMGHGRESLVFLAELTTRQATTQFIARYGNDAYYSHNDELHVDSAVDELSKRATDLDLNAPEDFVPGTSAGIRKGPDDGQDAKGNDAGMGKGATTMDDVRAYYSGKQHEFGFASMSRMNLPPDLKGKTVLDVCCRRGKGIYKLSARVGDSGRVIGTDWSSEYIDEARERSERAWHDNGLKGNNMEFHVAYPENLIEAGIGNSTVDVVYINNVATLLCDFDMALSEFARVLKPGGLLVCDTVVSSAPRNEEVVEKAREIGNSVQAARTSEELLASLSAAGFIDAVFTDEIDVDPAQGYKVGYKVETVPSDENVKFTAVCVSAVKPAKPAK
ncbi:MAG: methyltransferase domain-containing protein [Coriobacteriales bacterium]|jgi:ubiquinone/menaquinone biosynthesis C-methylase UbiE